MKKLDHYRNIIDRTNKQIVRLFGQRSKLGLNKEGYSKLSDAELVKKGIDPVFLPDYLSMLEQICANGTSRNNGGAFFVDSKLQRAILERIYLGQPIAQCKELYGLKMENKEREQEVLKQVSRHAFEFGLDAEKIRNIFSLIIKKTKAVEYAVSKSLQSNNGNSCLESYKTAIESCLGVLIAQAENKIDQLKKELGGDYFIKTKKESSLHFVGIYRR